MKSEGQIVCINCTDEFRKEGTEIFRIQKAQVAHEQKQTDLNIANLKSQIPAKLKSVTRYPSRKPNTKSVESKQPADEDYIENVNGIQRIYIALLLDEVEEISGRESLSNHDKLTLLRALISESNINDLF